MYKNTNTQIKSANKNEKNPKILNKNECNNIPANGSGIIFKFSISGS